MTKECLIVLAVYGFLSKEMEDYIEITGLTLPMIVCDPKEADTLRVIRILQKLEIQLGGCDHAHGEIEINKAIQRVNNKMGEITHVNAVVGLTMLMEYKEQWKGKKYAIGISWEDVNTVYNAIDSAFVYPHLDKKIIIESENLAHALYEEFLCLEGL